MSILKASIVMSTLRSTSSSVPVSNDHNHSHKADSPFVPEVNFLKIDANFEYPDLFPSVFSLDCWDKAGNSEQLKFWFYVCLCIAYLEFPSYRFF